MGIAQNVMVKDRYSGLSRSRLFLGRGERGRTESRGLQTIFNHHDGMRFCSPAGWLRIPLSSPRPERFTSIPHSLSGVWKRGRSRKGREIQLTPPPRLFHLTLTEHQSAPLRLGCGLPIFNLIIKKIFRALSQDAVAASPSRRGLSSRRGRASCSRRSPESFLVAGSNPASPAFQQHWPDSILTVS